jgi:transposase-like protein
MARGSKRKYTAQTRQDAVGQVIKAGLSLSQVARSFDVRQTKAALIEIG